MIVNSVTDNVIKIVISDKHLINISISTEILEKNWMLIA